MTIDELISEKLLDELGENYGANKSDIIETTKMILDKHADTAEDKEKFD